MSKFDKFTRLVVSLGAVVLLAACVAESHAEAEMKPGKRFRDCPDCPEMVSIQAGSLNMGTAGDPTVEPVHLVTLSYPFAIGKTEITEAQFRYFLHRTGYNAGDDHATKLLFPDRPAVDLDWYAASAYARWLSRYTGLRYRLPSEAEWEYAARAGTTTRYWWGDSEADACGKEYVYVAHAFDGPQCATSQIGDVMDVARLGANPWGLYDMMGNADEWVLDCPPSNVAAYAGAPADGTPFMGCGYTGYGQIVRGSELVYKPASRHQKDPAFRMKTLGFRIVRELP